MKEQLYEDLKVIDRTKHRKEKESHGKRREAREEPQYTHKASQDQYELEVLEYLKIMLVNN